MYVLRGWSAPTAVLAPAGPDGLSGIYLSCSPPNCRHPATVVDGRVIELAGNIELISQRSFAQYRHKANGPKSGALIWDIMATLRRGDIPTPPPPRQGANTVDLDQAVEDRSVDWPIRRGVHHFWLARTSSPLLPLGGPLLGVLPEQAGRMPKPRRRRDELFRTTASPGSWVPGLSI